MPFVTDVSRSFDVEASAILLSRVAPAPSNFIEKLVELTPVLLVNSIDAKTLRLDKLETKEAPASLILPVVVFTSFPKYDSYASPG